MYFFGACIFALLVSSIFTDEKSFSVRKNERYLSAEENSPSEFLGDQDRSFPLPQTGKYSVKNSCFKRYPALDRGVILKDPNLRRCLYLQKLNKIRNSYAQCSAIPPERRLNCLPLKDVSKDLCLKLNCCWDESVVGLDPQIFPRCYFSRFTYHYRITMLNETYSGYEGILKIVRPSGFPNDVSKLKLSVTFCDNSTFRLRITDFISPRYEVPLPISPSSCSSVLSSSTLYDVRLYPNGKFIIMRKNSTSHIFSTDLTTLVFSDKFLQFSTSLPSHYIYGLGDHMSPLLKSTNWTKYTFFNRDQIPEENMNLYTSLPFYLILEESGNSHGVFLFNSNAMDVILQPAPSLTFRTVGGVLDFFFFLGPTPNEVVQQFVRLVGLPAMPPYWSLGFHLSRLGYSTVNKTMEVWKRTVDAGIPFDTQWNDIDYMDRYNDFTYDKDNFKGLPDFVRSLHQLGMHYMLIIDPGISSAEPKGTYPPFDEGIASNVFIKNASGQLLETKVWNKVSSVFPDFTNPITARYWEKQLNDFHSIIPFDGVWLDMNEPTNFLNGSFWGCPDSPLETPPYVPGNDALCTKTICMTAQHYLSHHYNVHNIYGTFQTEATYRAMADIRHKRPFVLTRAGFPGIGRFAAMWNGDVISLWEHMQASIPSILGYNMAGIPMSGADICGFNNNTSVELCARWFSLGAFYPFCRNHNSDENMEQDPVALGPVVVAAAKSALSARYLLLPYLYTLLYKSHISGQPVMRPLFFEYPNDVVTYHIDRQFFWGPALMITPVLEPGVREVSGYFPHDVWYDFYTGRKWKSLGQEYTMDAPLDKINLAVRSGFILPTQEVNGTTTLSRENKFMLLVALNTVGKAYGELYWDDGESLDAVSSKSYNFITFVASENCLNSTLQLVGYETEMILGGIQLYGVQPKPKRVLVNDMPVDFTYNYSSEVLQIPYISVSLLKPICVLW